MNLFEEAALRGYRYPTIRGVVTTEQLYNMQLLGDFSLNEVAKTLNKAIKERVEENFVELSPHREEDLDGKKLQIVKHIIAFKKSEKEERENALVRQRERNTLIELLHERQHEDLRELSKEEIEAKLKELG